jgi:hypothetical protein
VVSRPVYLVQPTRNRTTHQLPSDIEDDSDEGEDQECAAGEDKRRRLVNKRKLGREVGKAERRIVRRGGNRHAFVTMDMGCRWGFDYVSCTN